jgi:molybdopterin-guanine dinucleotide biosynthesis protein A
MAKNQLTGIILSGGKSSRMGLEKGLVDFRGKPLITYAIEALKPIADTLIISANNRLDEYGQYGYEIFQDEIKEVGPIGGLYTVLKNSKTEINLVLSCDMPFVTTELLEYLFRNMQQNDVVVAVRDEVSLEPLCGCYSRNMVNALEQQIAAGNYKLRDLFGKVKFKALKIDASLPFYKDNLFYNVNRPEDLK